MVYQLICVLSSTLVCTNTNILKKERQIRSRPKVFQKEPGFKVWNHSRSLKHPPVTSTNFLPCHKTSSNPFPMAGENGWLRSRRAQNTGHFVQTHAGCPSVHLHCKLASLPKKVTLRRLLTTFPLSPYPVGHVCIGLFQRSHRSKGRTTGLDKVPTSNHGSQCETNCSAKQCAVSSCTTIVQQLYVQ